MYSTDRAKIVADRNHLLCILLVHNFNEVWDHLIPSIFTRIYRIERKEVCSIAAIDKLHLEYLFCNLKEACFCEKTHFVEDFNYASH